jgi:glycosyltransferase involved in cell wall biosynthesis
MAGPGIRYWEMAQALARRLNVTLAAPGRGLEGEGYSPHAYERGEWSTIKAAVGRSDVLMFSGDLLLDFPQLVTCGRPLVIEATYPYTFEGLQLTSERPLEDQMPGYLARLETMRRTGRAGDFYFCACERQRAYWLGVLDACGRINPATYGQDRSLRQLIDTVPFGLPSRSPVFSAPAMKGVIPGIGRTDRVVLWGGGLWEWLDSLSLVRAIALITEQRPDVRLVFPATKHPNPNIPEMPMLQQTKELSQRLGLTNRVVFFGDWVPYELWPNYLLEADVGASLHFDTLETHFAFRTRILDYIWSGLPMVATGGDETSDLVAHYGLGEIVPPEDEEAVAGAILRLLNTSRLRGSYDDRYNEVRQKLAWERVCEPIARFCERPSFAPDRASGLEPTLTAGFGGPSKENTTELERLRSVVDGYESGRFIRFMAWLNSMRNRKPAIPN